MTTRVSEVNMTQFKNAVMFSIELKGWGNRSQVKDTNALVKYLGMLNEERREAAEEAKQEGKDVAEEPALSNVPKRIIQDRKSISVSKVLIRSDAFKSLIERMKKAKKDALALSMPSFVKSGMFAVRKELIETVDGILERAAKEVEDTYLPQFILDYPTAIERAKEARLMRGGLGPLWREQDYPSVDVMASKFGINWNWLTLTLPDEGLPKELREREAEKLSRIYSDASKEIKNALRVMFGELLEHATERLTIKPGEEPKKFKNTLVSNLTDFFETFEARNLMDDSDLSQVVQQCKEVMTGVTPDKLRKDMSVREQTAESLEKIKEIVEPMIETEGRAFTFDD